MGNYTRRPEVTEAVRWTGDNLAEFEAWAATFQNFTWSFQQVGDDLQITIAPSGGGPVLILRDQWAIGYGLGYNVSGMDDATFQATFQELPGAAPQTYTITGS